MTLFSGFDTKMTKTQGDDEICPVRFELKVDIS